MRPALLALPFVLVACDAESRNSASRSIGEAIGSIAHETSRAAEEAAKGAIEESQKKREAELGTPQEQTDRMMRELRQKQEQERIRRDKGFPGHASSQGFPGHEK